MTPELSPFKSLEDLTKKSGPENTLKRRTNSQTMLLDLPVESEKINAMNERKTNVRKQNSLGLSIDSRIVFFEESGIPLRGTVKFIGPVTKLSEVFVGVELVS